MITIGTDPELFSLNASGYINPAYKVLGGDKEIKLPYGKAYCDGAAIEQTITPSGSAYELVEKLEKNIVALQEFVGPLSTQSSAPLHIEDIVASKGMDRGDMTILGCNPDVRVYDWTSLPKRPDPKVYKYRSVGAHIHIGLPEKYLDGLTFRQFLTAFFDAIIGTSLITIVADEVTKRRNELYGQAGTVRYTTYDSDITPGGVEYRTPPAITIRDSRIALAVFSAAYNIVDWMVRELDKRGDYSRLLHILGGVDQMKKTQMAIDTHDRNACLNARHNIYSILYREVDFQSIYLYEFVNYKVKW